LFIGARDDILQEPDKICMLGKVQQKLECRPVPNSEYMQLKRQEIKKAAQPVRKVLKIDHVVNVYKPVSNHKINVSNNVHRIAVVCFLNYIFIVATARNRSQKFKNI